MNVRFALLLAGTAALGCTAHIDAGAPEGDSPQLIEALSGRSAERELSCVSLHELDGHRLFPRDQAVLFEGPGSLLYLNRFGGECSTMRDGLALRLSTPTGRLCEGHIVQFFDATADIPHGACSLGVFTPFRRAM